MTYFAAALIAIPVTMCGIVGVLKSRVAFKRFMDLVNERRMAEMGDIGAAPVPECLDEMRFTESLLALSRVRSPRHDDSQELEHAESSSLVLAHRAQSRTPDRAA